MNEDCVTGLCRALALALATDPAIPFAIVLDAVQATSTCERTVSRWPQSSDVVRKEES
jgi:hypothetical protein